MMNSNDFVIPAFLDKNKTSKVKAININNDKHIKEVMNMSNRQEEVSNYITDMTLNGASKDQLADAIRYSMDVIDSEKNKNKVEEGDCVDSGLDPDEVLVIKEQDGNYSYEKNLVKAIKKRADEIDKPITPIFKSSVSEAQLKDVARMARALRPEEIKVVLDNIPVNYIYDKIGQVLETNRKFNEAIMAATDIIKD